jgi:hypothetical protein
MFSIGQNKYIQKKSPSIIALDFCTRFACASRKREVHFRVLPETEPHSPFLRTKRGQRILKR